MSYYKIIFTYLTTGREIWERRWYFILRNISGRSTPRPSRRMMTDFFILAKLRPAAFFTHSPHSTTLAPPPSHRRRPNNPSPAHHHPILAPGRPNLPHQTSPTKPAPKPAPRPPTSPPRSPISPPRRPNKIKAFSAQSHPHECRPNPHEIFFKKQKNKCYFDRS
jgi:hypothetical protein